MEALFTLKDLRVQCVIGCLEHERALTQELLVTIRYKVECALGCKTDTLGYSLDYSEVAAHAFDLAQKEYYLIETYAFELLHLLKERYPMQWLRVEVSKPSALPLASHVQVAFEL